MCRIIFLVLVFVLPSLCLGQQSTSEKPLLERVREEHTLFIELLKESPADDELNRLIRLRAKVALECMQAAEARYNSGLDNINQLIEAQKTLAEASIELLQGKNRILALNYVLDLTRLMHQRASELSKVGAGGGDSLTVSKARLAVIEAEIKLLKERRNQM